MLAMVAFAGVTHGQTIDVRGQVTDKNGNNTLLNIMVVNQATGNGSFAGANGTFAIKVQKKDTILITARDYSIRKLCFHDSANKPSFYVQVKLDSIHYELSEVDVYARPGLKDIHKDIDNLGNIPNTDTYKEASIMNPISLLYERFSRIEQSKRKVAQMEDDEKRRQVLKDLLHLYIKYDIINLDDKSFDSFIDYCGVTDALIKQATDYELIMFIKQRYERYQRATSNDYYHK